MADLLSKADRSRHMAKIKRANTKPERVVRSILHRLGSRFRLPLADVPGRPDIGFRNRKKAIMIHGCFWHAHEGCRHSRIPKTRPEFWRAKFARNRERDQRLLREAEEAGWKVLVLWECQITDTPTLVERLEAFLGAPTFQSISSEGRVPR